MSLKGCIIRVRRVTHLLPALQCEGNKDSVIEIYLIKLKLKDDVD